VLLSGRGPASGGDFAPAGPGAIRELHLTLAQDGSGPIRVDLVCDAVREIAFNWLTAPPFGMDEELPAVIELPAGATACHFEVEASGEWVLRSH
jgi:hypothetical protein